MIIIKKYKFINYLIFYKCISKIYKKKLENKNYIIKNFIIFKIIV